MPFIIYIYEQLRCYFDKHENENKLFDSKEMHVFVGFFSLFFTHRDFVKKNLLRAFEEKSECKTYMPTTLGVFA